MKLNKKLYTNKLNLKKNYIIELIHFGANSRSTNKSYILQLVVAQLKHLCLFDLCIVAHFGICGSSIETIIGY